MKWKRSKKAQQEAKAKAAAERAAKANGTPLPMKSPGENKSKRITEEDEAMSSDPEDHDIDVGGEDETPEPLMSPLGPSNPNLVAPTPILGLPQPPALQLRPLLPPGALIRPPIYEAAPGVHPMETHLSALLPAHLARLSQAGNRLHRPFVA